MSCYRLKLLVLIATTTVLAATRRVTAAEQRQAPAVLPDRSGSVADQIAAGVEGLQLVYQGCHVPGQPVPVADRRALPRKRSTPTMSLASIKRRYMRAGRERVAWIANPPTANVSLGMAMLVHGEEALLATGFIFAFYFFPITRGPRKWGSSPRSCYTGTED
jgi:hypothetical protein